MDYQASIEQYVMEINNQLADAEGLNTSQIVPKLQTLINSGYQNFIIQTIRTCIHHYSKDRAILKYAYVVDKLLKMPVFNQIVQNVIVQFFCDIIIFLLFQKCYNQIDELKILRKFWLKTIHPRHLQAMRDIIFGQTGIDIDQHFKPDVISVLRNHYEKKLKLTPQQMNFHLPKTIKTSNLIYESKSSKPPQQHIFSENANYNLIQERPHIPVNMNPNNMRHSHSPQPLMNITNPSPYRNAFSVPPQNIQISHNAQNPAYFSQNPILNHQPFQMKANMHQRMSPPVDPIDPRFMNEKRFQVPSQRIIQLENVPIYPQKKQMFNENYKRDRIYSQQTRTSNGSEHMLMQPSPQSINHLYKKTHYQIEPHPQKKVHYNDNYDFFRQEPLLCEKEAQKPKYAKFLQMFQTEKHLKCKQCGKGYKNMSEYNKHITEHFEQKLALKEKKRTTQKLMNIDEWTNGRSRCSLQQFDQFYITLSNLASSDLDEQNINYIPLQLKCRLCNEQFDLKFHMDQWTLNNATFCLIDGQKVPMHKTCQQALDDSSGENL